jgi:hypothetical protein
VSADRQVCLEVVGAYVIALLPTALDIGFGFKHSVRQSLPIPIDHVKFLTPIGSSMLAIANEDEMILIYRRDFSEPVGVRSWYLYVINIY